VSEPTYAEVYESQFSRNEHGVEGVVSRGTFIPRVCYEGCPLFDEDSDLDGYHVWHFCTRNLKFPTRKGTCKLRDKTVGERGSRGV
jgi:hypothetical protein